LDAIEGWFAIDDPLLVVEVFSEGFEVCGIFEMTETVGKDKIIFFEGIVEKIKNLPLNNATSPDRDEKTLRMRSNGLRPRRVRPVTIQWRWDDP